MPRLCDGYDFTHDTYLAKALPGTRLYNRIHTSLPVVSNGLLTRNLKIIEMNVFYLTPDKTNSADF